MGQSVTVVAKHSSNPEILRFEINRSLTGMGHERYRSLADIVRDRPVDRLARRLLDHGGIDAVHINSSMITVDLGGGYTGDGLLEIIENLFRFYPDVPPSEEAPVEESASEAAADAEDADLVATPDAAAADADDDRRDTPEVAPAEAPDPDRPADESATAD